MILSLGLLVAAVMVARFCGDTPVGAWLHRLLVEAPAAGLSRLTLRQALAALVVVSALAALAPAMPIELALWAAGDLAGYMELVAVLGAAAAALRGRALWRAVRSTGSAVLRSIGGAAEIRGGFEHSGARASRRRPARRLKPDDDGEGDMRGLAVA